MGWPSALFLLLISNRHAGQEIGSVSVTPYLVRDKKMSRPFGGSLAAANPLQGSRARQNAGGRQTQPAPPPHMSFIM
jgi:hypothetical protein